MSPTQVEMMAEELNRDQYGEGPGDENGDTCPECGSDDQLSDHGGVTKTVVGARGEGETGAASDSRASGNNRLIWPSLVDGGMFVGEPVREAWSIQRRRASHGRVCSQSSSVDGRLARNV